MGLDPERLWTIEQVADFLQTERSKVRYWVRVAQFPFIRLGRQVRFDPNDVKAWVARHKVESLSSREFRKIS